MVDYKTNVFLELNLVRNKHLVTYVSSNISFGPIDFEAIVQRTRQTEISIDLDVQPFPSMIINCTRSAFLDAMRGVNILDNRKENYSISMRRPYMFYIHKAMMRQ